jgi:hypothetical protein
MDADESPRQMLGRIMGLTPVGLAKERTPPDGGKGDHQQRAASPLLDHVRASQIQAQAHRTATRLRELEQEATRLNELQQEKSDEWKIG